MKKVKDWLLKDIWLKVVSVLLAIVIWFVWIQIENPTISKDFTGVKVQITNEEALDPERKVWEVLDNTDTLRVTVTAPKTVINGLSSDDIIAEADATKLSDGTIPISLRLFGDLTYDSLTANRENITISLEDRVRRYVRIIKNTTGEVAEGCKFGGVTMDLNMIEITGPKSDVESVSYGQVNIDIDGVSESLSANIEIELCDSSNNVLNLSSVTKQSDYVHVDVNILETKNIPVYASKTGEPAEGYLYAGDIEITPELVSVAGSHANLSTISRISITEPVDITGATGDVEKTVDISQYLPDGVQFTDDDFDKNVVVKILVEPEEEKNLSFSSQSVTFTNVPSDCSLETAASTIHVVLKGLSSDLENITEDTLGRTIDVAEFMDNNDIAELEEGEYEMPVTLGVSSSVTVETIPIVKVIVKK
ncbi:MAG: hypothetical protein K5669_10770 [Lachnospiraceae bacterium]|nr:hypothetical protein [Lachnospiraceae bacterium]